MRAVCWIVCVAALLPAAAAAAVSTGSPAAAARAASAASAKPPAPPPWPDTASGLFAAPTSRTRVGQVVAPVMIDGKGPFRFLVDTGANGCVASPQLVRALGLVPVHATNEQVEGTTGTERLPWVLIRKMRIGNIVKRDLRLPVSDSPVLRGLDGILGMAGFGAVQVVVDFNGNRVIIDRPKPRPLQRSGFLAIQARRTPGGLLMIPARVGGVEVSAVIDTGSEGTIGNDALRRALLREAARKKAKNTTIYGVTKQVTQGGVAAAPAIDLGSVEIRNLAIVYAQIPIFKDWHLDSRPALLVGMNVLGTVNALVLDYPRARVYVEPVTHGGASVTVHYLYHSSLLKTDGGD